MSSPEVVIIGGGVMGCGIALRLAQEKVRATVLEKSVPGAEASSAAAGILAPQIEAEGPGPFFDLCLRSRELFPGFARELAELSGIDVQYVPCGLFSVAFTRAGADRMESIVTWQRSAGLRAEMLDGTAAREIEPNLTPEAIAAAHFPDDHQVDSRLLVRALAIAAARAGAKFRTGHVRRVIVEGGRATGVDVEGEVLGADVVVVAAGAWSSLVPGANIPSELVRPAKGQMVELQLRVPPLRRVLFSERHGYVVPRRDGRVLCGSTMEFRGFEKQVTAGGLAAILRIAIELCPSLAHAEVLSHWAGLRPYTEDHLPYLGDGPALGLVLATGHFRNGILLAPITARVIAEAVLGRTPSVDLSPFRFDRRPLAR